MKPERIAELLCLWMVPVLPPETSQTMRTELLRNFPGVRKVQLEERHGLLHPLAWGMAIAMAFVCVGWITLHKSANRDGTAWFNVVEKSFNGCLESITISGNDYTMKLSDAPADGKIVAIQFQGNDPLKVIAKSGSTVSFQKPFGRHQLLVLVTPEGSAILVLDNHVWQGQGAGVLGDAQFVVKVL